MRVDSNGGRTLEQRGGRRMVEGGQPQLGQAGVDQGRVLPVAHSYQHRDGVCQQSTRGEGQRLGGRAVQPLRIVHDHQHRRLLGVARDQPQCGGTHQQTVGLDALAEAEGGSECRGMGGWESLEQRQGGAKQFVQAREGDVRLELDAARGEHSHLDSTLHRKAEEGSLADPGLAADDQRRAAPKAGVGERPLYGRHLPVATEQHPTGMLWRRPPDNQGGP